MGTLDLKAGIHKIVDSIQREQLLQTLYDFLKVRTTTTSGKLWDSLTDQEKREVLISYDESEDESSLISRKDMFRPE